MYFLNCRQKVDVLSLMKKKETKYYVLYLMQQKGNKIKRTDEINAILCENVWIWPGIAFKSKYKTNAVKKTHSKCAIKTEKREFCSYLAEPNMVTWTPIYAICNHRLVCLIVQVQWFEANSGKFEHFEKWQR